jgi:hypothetical protein
MIYNTTYELPFGTSPSEEDADYQTYVENHKTEITFEALIMGTIALFYCYF